MPGEKRAVVEPGRPGDCDGVANTDGYFRVGFDCSVVQALLDESSSGYNLFSAVFVYILTEIAFPPDPTVVFSISVSTTLRTTLIYLNNRGGGIFKRC